MGDLAVLILLIIIPGHSSTPDRLNEDTINPNTNDVPEVTIDGALGNGRAFLSGSEWVGYRYNEKAPSNCCTSCKLKHPSTEGFTYAVDEQKCVCYTFEKGATIHTKSYKGLESQLCGSLVASKPLKTLYSEATEKRGDCPFGYTEDVVPSGYTFNWMLNVDSIEDCGLECDRNVNCTSFTFSPDKQTKNCGMMDEDIWYDNGLEDVLLCKKTSGSKVFGEMCKRNCTEDPEDNKYCYFYFVLSQQFSDTPGRLADGMNRSVLVYNEVLPGPTIVVCQGDKVFVRLINRLTGDNEKLLGKISKLPINATTLHFHGIRAKEKNIVHKYKDKLNSSKDATYIDGGAMYDGVPLVTQCPVLTGDSYEYQLPGSGAVDSDYNNAPAGSYLYHSHMGIQRINGAAGKLIIMPRKANRSRYDVDLPENSLILQEWYPNLDTEVAGTLLVNGKGKQDDMIYKCDDLENEKACIENYKQGKKVRFTSYKREKIYEAGQNGSPSDEPDYEVFNITEPGLRYRFRIIGAIGEDYPIRISIEDHTFTAISVDSIDIEPVPEFDALWVTAGERYDIVIHTKLKPRKNLAYKINVFHESDNIVIRCSMAWLKYPNQKVNKEYKANCSDMQYETFKKVLNPVPNDFSRWGKSKDSTQTEYIYPINLTSQPQEERIESYLNTQYINMTALNFNNIQMPFPEKFPDVPFLLQSPTDFSDQISHRCGVKCNFNFTNGGFKTDCQEITGGFTSNEGSINQQCQHVMQLPLPPQPPYLNKKFYFEIVLINVHAVAHPIHHHGGWFNIVGMGQFDKESFNINTTEIIKMDHSCSEGKQCLPRNFTQPIHKDTIQVPTNGYVIFRIPLDNPGVSFMHCHISNHLELGMAMVIQIGETWQWKVKQNENKDCYDIPGLEKGW